MSHAVNAALMTAAILVIVQVASLVVQRLRPTPELKPIPVESDRKRRPGQPRR
ncbi:hypothetical protein V8J36_13095 [Frigidibacter sp. MR17.14]|uniref:hypothetical protein n=1 Tax=Frigidibacter sp. MR17.14 TaxID=3126509 RepID=UPI003012A607